MWIFSPLWPFPNVSPSTFFRDNVSMSKITITRYEIYKWDTKIFNRCRENLPYQCTISLWMRYLAPAVVVSGHWRFCSLNKAREVKLILYLYSIYGRSLHIIIYFYHYFAIKCLSIFLSDMIKPPFSRNATDLDHVAPDIEWEPDNQRVAHYTIHSLVDHYGSLFYLKSSYKTIHSAQRHSACSPQVLELMKEVTEEEDDENISSDISGEQYFVVTMG